jgi:hypothetical protein
MEDLRDDSLMISAKIVGFLATILIASHASFSLISEYLTAGVKTFAVFFPF